MLRTACYAEALFFASPSCGFWLFFAGYVLETVARRCPPREVCDHPPALPDADAFAFLRIVLHYHPRSDSRTSVSSWLNSVGSRWTQDVRFLVADLPPSDLRALRLAVFDTLAQYQLVAAGHFLQMLEFFAPSRGFFRPGVSWTLLKG